jgi:simple sugar transport system ATP-binding protein
MVGRKVLLQVDKVPAKPGDVILDVQNLNVTDAQGVHRVKNVSFNIRAGEILGIAGVAGNGQSELLEVLGGYEKGTGTITVNGQPIDLTGKYSDGQSRRKRGIAHVPEDRQREGLVMNFSAWENTAFGYHSDPRYQKNVLLWITLRSRPIPPKKWNVSTCGRLTRCWPPRTSLVATNRK